MGLPMDQKLVKSGSTWARLCGTHIFETAGWIYTIWSSLELSRPVVVQHQGHLTLTIDFQGQILKTLYLRNGRADWHGTKGMWVNRMLDPHCDFELCPHPWPWPLIFNSGMGWPIDMEQILKMLYFSNGMPDWHGTKRIWFDRMWGSHCGFELWPHPWPWPWIFKVNFFK